MVVAALSDVHGPRYINYLRASLGELERASLVLMAGDIVDKGNPSHCRLVVDVLRGAYKGTIIGVFGNEEYDEYEPALRQLCDDVIWLKDEAIDLELNDLPITIVGTRGSLDQPTRWQERNIPNIVEIYENRLRTLDRLLAEARERSRLVILLTHYAPICSTLEGEPPRIWSQMGSRKLTQLILRHRPDVVIHGHAHNSVRVHTQLGPTRVFNVALPAVKRVTLVHLQNSARGVTWGL